MCDKLATNICCYILYYYIGTVYSCYPGAVFCSSSWRPTVQRRPVALLPLPSDTPGANWDRLSQTNDNSMILNFYQPKDQNQISINFKCLFQISNHQTSLFGREKATRSSMSSWTLGKDPQLPNGSRSTSTASCFTPKTLQERPHHSSLRGWQLPACVLKDLYFGPSCEGGKS